MISPQKLLWMLTTLIILQNTPAEAKSLLLSLEQTARGISLYVNLDKKNFEF